MSPLGPPKIAYADSVSCPHGGVLVKFSTSNNRTSDGPHWLRYRHCAKLKNTTIGTHICVVRGPSAACGRPGGRTRFSELGERPA
ncbi:unnamed protein product [Macrosiphum euphorbiae]|uniref:Uncharacterized protein n=1 Tax=Macrosiphum euphorbiae TaxID=13131 RepID=A0AAV0XD92_9HEMI|nr:unnamed protein product [Macrosiphum euphorbiae]